MSRHRHKLALVVATMDRPADLRRLFESLRRQTAPADRIVVVDGGSTPCDHVCGEYGDLPIAYHRCLPPSATRQRNVGIGAVGPGPTLIGLLDDDVVLEPTALEEILDAWETADESLGGTALNMVNHPKMVASKMKSWRLTEKLGLYSSKGGVVTPSGFQTMIGRVKENQNVAWLPSTACVWRREVFDRFLFDEWYSGYSYLEDLDFSYSVGRVYRLAVLAKANYSHFPGKGGRGKDFVFGKREVFNRLHFVRKNPELSVSRCRLALLFLLAMHLVLGIVRLRTGFFSRALGNFIGLLQGGSV